MKLLINCSNLKIGGGLQVALSVLNELRKYSQHSYVVVVSQQLRESVDLIDFPTNFSFIFYNLQLSLSTLCGRNKILDNIVEQYRIEKVFTIFGPAYWIPRVTHVCGYAKPQYIYTDSPFFETLSLKSKIKIKIKKHIHLYFFSKANTLITESQDVTCKLQSLFPTLQVFTVTNYYNQIFEEKEKWEIIDLPKFEGITLLTIAANYPHKNLQIIPKVIKSLNQTNPNFKFRFVISQPENIFGNLDNLIKKHIVFLNKVRIDQCPSLYEQADIMILPTLLECFSASYAEAMYMQTPIITSDLGFSRALCGDAAVYVDTLLEDKISENIIALAEDKTKQQELIEAGFLQLKTFDHYTKRTQKYIEILENETNNTRP